MSDSWWKDGASLMDKNGRVASLKISPHGEVSMQFQDTNGYLLHPNPDDWSPVRPCTISFMQKRQLLYEVDRIVLGFFGRYGLTEWASLRDDEKAADPPVLPAPMAEDGILHLREKIRKAIERALGRTGAKAA